MKQLLHRPHKSQGSVENHKIIFLARSQQSINLYRISLIKSLSQFLKIDTLGVFTFLSLPWIWHSYKILITSDSICNLICLKLSTPQLMILNGFGRYRNVKMFRGYVIYLINSKANVEICVQNYLDYRYLRKYVQRKIYWIPGSGGTPRVTGVDENPVVITRDSKLKKQLNAFRNIETLFRKIHIVGLHKSILENGRYINWGRREQASIFSNFKTFLQVDGYGEGVPHSLVDAICSNMNIYITRRSWVQFGFYKLIKSSENIICDDYGFLFVKSNSDILEQLNSKLCANSINAQYSKYILRFVNQR